jgi:hypothetical protein
LSGNAESQGCYGFLPARNGDHEILFTVERRQGRWQCCWPENGRVRSKLLPEAFDPLTFQQFRFRLNGDQLSVFHEADLLTELNTVEPAGTVGLFARHAPVAFDMVRLTAIA